MMWLLGTVSPDLEEIVREDPATAPSSGLLWNISSLVTVNITPSTSMLPSHVPNSTFRPKHGPWHVGTPLGRASPSTTLKISLLILFIRS